MPRLGSHCVTACCPLHKQGVTRSPIKSSRKTSSHSVIRAPRYICISVFIRSFLSLLKMNSPPPPLPFPWMRVFTPQTCCHIMDCICDKQMRISSSQSVLDADCLWNSTLLSLMKKKKIAMLPLLRHPDLHNHQRLLFSQLKSRGCCHLSIPLLHQN